MIYNILIVDDINPSNEYVETFENLVNKELIFVSDLNKLPNIFKTTNIHSIIVNPQTIRVKELVSQMMDANKDDTNIPILIVAEYCEDQEYKCDNLICDFVSLDRKLQLSNKIKFCKNLYKKELEHETHVKKLLYIDNLTKSPNRTKLIEDVRNDNIGISSLAIIDINSFKEINDFFGHKIGDNILIGIADIIKDIIEKYSNQLIFYKFPADTYCLANTTLAKEKFVDIVKDIILAIDEKVFLEGEHEIDTRATVGISFSTKNNKLITADLALQAAKKDHKDYLIFYDELDNLKEYQNNMVWTKKVKQALELDKIIVYFQPLINNRTMNVDKYECLVRMVDGDRIVSPFFFLEISKKANQYSKITKKVIEKSFAQFADLPFEFSVNVSYEDIEDPSFLDYIKEQLKIYNIAHRVVWEILEDEDVKNYDVLLSFISEVKALGCKVAIDDFGSGYSNFEHLLKMNVDYLKIDASLIKHVATDENSYKVVKTIMDFARSLNLKTITEFVENEEIFKITKELGADYSQGYYFAPPLDKPNIYTFEGIK
jgi:diguanylate cyclase (GGDEF)-like protein